MQSASPTVSDIILRQLSLWGIRRIYGVAGDAVLPFLHAVGQQTAVQYIAARHESGAAFMASAEGKCSREMAVCLGTSGPGLVNMLNGIADATADRVPLLVLTGQIALKKVGTEAKQYIEQQQMIAPLAVYSAQLLHPDATVEVLQKAVIEAHSKRGVAHISVPVDVWNAPCSREPHQPTGVLKTSRYQNLEQLEQAVNLLSAAEAPMILIGTGARGASRAIAELAEAMGAGIVETLGAKGTVPHSHPLNVGGIGEGGSEASRNLLQQSDCVLAVGANWWPEGFVPKDTQVIHIDTAPASIEAHPEVVCGLVGDAAEILPLIRQQLPQGPKSSWQGHIHEARAHFDASLDRERQNDAHPVAPQRVIAALDETVDDRAIVAVDTGDHTVWFNRVFRATQQDILFSGKWRTMGFALPAAIAAKLTFPERQVVACVGDGSFAMTMMELATAVTYRTPVSVIVMNNRSLSMEKNSMNAQGMQPFGTELINPNFADLAQAFGAKGIHVETADELSPALETAFTCGEPAVVDVHTSDAMPPFTYFKQAVQ